MQKGVVHDGSIQRGLHVVLLVNIVDHRGIEKGARADRARHAESAPEGAGSSIAGPGDRVELGPDVVLDVVGTVYSPLWDSRKNCANSRRQTPAFQRKNRDPPGQRPVEVDKYQPTCPESRCRD